DVGGKVYYNVLFRPKAGAWASFHGLNGSQYQQRFNQYTRQGYRPHQVESHLGGGSVRYAVIFRKQGGPQYTAYHGLTAAAHQQRFDTLTGQGYRPRNVSVVSSGGQRRYTALYEKADIGSWEARSQLNATQYQQAFESNTGRKRQLVYLNSYVHGGQPYFTAIWSSRPSGAYRARHGLTSARYQSEWTSASRSNMRTGSVTGYGVGGPARYAAFWRGCPVCRCDGPREPAQPDPCAARFMRIPVPGRSIRGAGKTPAGPGNMIALPRPSTGCWARLRATSRAARPPPGRPVTT